MSHAVLDTPSVILDHRQDLKVYLCNDLLFERRRANHKEQVDVPQSQNEPPESHFPD